MSIVRAFVGHSFTEGDKTLNDTFLEYLDQIKKMGIGFTWEHAKAAEPRELAEKVMKLIQDKNLFIGICTKKERVIGPNELERCWIRRKLLRSHESKFLWKTSDWILQEIGLAVGQKMDLILLIEEGLRLPGGLQGNIEYIEFSRSFPQRSFVKLLEMIQVLLPKATIALTPDLKIESPENVMQNQRKEEDDNWWLEPKAEWNESRYRQALFRSIITENSEAESNINSAFLQSPDCHTQNGLASWTAFGQYFHLLRGQGGSLEKMEQLAKESPEVYEVQFHLGRAYELYKEYEKAGQAYIRASGQAADAQDRLYNLGEAAKAYSRGGIKSEAESICESMRQEVLQSGEAEKTFVEALREVAGINSDMDNYYALSERLLELNPGDTDTRFNLAYKYSQGSEEKLSLFHYLRIPNLDKPEPKRF
jgi:tetratricopeptide (TPR) repeat protein